MTNKPKARECVAKNEYTSANLTWVSFGWICKETNCGAVNYLSWSSYAAYGGVDECKKCETAHNVKVPFK